MDDSAMVELDTVSRLIFHLLYTTFARIYDLIAWIVSMGQWRNWQTAGTKVIPAGAVLEIGHGPGHLLKDLALDGLNIVGIDLSAQMVRLAAHRLQRAGLPQTAARAKVQALPFPDGHFDSVLSTFPSEYILDAQTLMEVCRVLRPEGLLVIVPAAWIDSNLIYDRFAAWLQKATTRPSTPHLDLSETLKRLGFSVQLDHVRQPRGVVVRIVAQKTRSDPA